MGYLSCNILNTTLTWMPWSAWRSLLICTSSSSWLTQRIMKMKGWQHVCLSSFDQCLAAAQKPSHELDQTAFFVVCCLDLAARFLLFGKPKFIYSHVLLHTCCRLITDLIERGPFGLKTRQDTPCVFCIHISVSHCLSVKAFSRTHMQMLNKLLIRQGISFKGFAWENSAKSS